MTNPLLSESDLPYHLPDFAVIRFEHYQEAVDAGLAQAKAEIEAIATSEELPSFENTIVALERSGVVLDRALTVVYNQLSSDSTPELRDLEAEYAPILTAHHDAVWLDPRLYERVQAVADALPSSGLDAESRYLVERYATRFRLAGAGLEEQAKQRLKELNVELAELTTRFEKNLLDDTNDLAVVFDTADELDGLTDGQLSSCAASAAERGLDGKYVVSLVLYSVHPFLAQLTNRDSRRRIYEATAARGNRGNAFDNNDLVRRIVGLRAERAAVLGYPNHVAASLADQTAKGPEAVEQVVYPLAAPAVANLKAEAAALQQQIDAAQAELGEASFELQPWDWAFYTERERQSRYAVDTAALRPWFEYDRVLRDGVFYAAGELFGLTFEERPELVAYHPGARVFEVFDADGTGIGLFLHDVYTRDSKRGGAWMNNLVDQSTLMGTKPVVVNNLNVPKPAEGEPTLLSLDEVRTMFHEFGHALHGLLSDVTYPMLSGTRVARDFVEFPSQVNEMWITYPEIIDNYARHVDTDEPIDPQVLAKLRESEAFNEGFATTEYLGAALLDQEWHKIAPGTVIDDVQGFERDALERVGLANPWVAPRYRTTYFAHTFSGGYDAGYYGYIWSEILDADTVEWFTENGGLSRENGDTFRAELLSRGRTRDPLESFRAFRGRDADIRPLLVRRGLNEGEAS